MTVDELEAVTADDFEWWAELIRWRNHWGVKVHYRTAKVAGSRGRGRGWTVFFTWPETDETFAAVVGRLELELLGHWRRTVGLAHRAGT